MIIKIYLKIHKRFYRFFVDGYDTYMLMLYGHFITWYVVMLTCAQNNIKDIHLRMHHQKTIVMFDGNFYCICSLFKYHIVLSSTETITCTIIHQKHDNVNCMIETGRVAAWLLIATSQTYHYFVCADVLYISCWFLWQYPSLIIQYISI